MIEKAGAGCLPDLVTYNTLLHAWARFTAHQLESLILGKSQDIFMLRHLWVSIGTTIFKSILQSCFLKPHELPAIDQAWSKLHSNMEKVHQFCSTSLPAVALLQCRRYNVEFVEFLHLSDERFSLKNIFRYRNNREFLPVTCEFQLLGKSICMFKKSD